MQLFWMGHASQGGKAFSTPVLLPQVRASSLNHLPVLATLLVSMIGTLQLVVYFFGARPLTPPTRRLGR